MTKARDQQGIQFLPDMGRHVFRLVLLLAACLATPAVADTKPDEFFGPYRGLGVAEDDSGAFIRNFSVTVLPAEAGGFEISWTTERRRSIDSRTVTEVSSHAAKFRPSGKPGVYHAIDNSGLLDNGQLSWARLHDKILTIYRIVVDADSVPELHVYHRKLTPGGMDLHFTAWRDGKWVRRVRGQLVRE